MGLKVNRFDFGVWSLNAKQTLMILSFFHTLLYVIYCASAQRTEHVRNVMIPNVPENHHISSWDITSSDKNAALYSSLMDILEKLDIVQVDENSSSCVTLGKIVREVESVKSDGISKNVKVTFHFTDTRHSIINQESAQNENPSKDKNGPTYSTGGLKSPRCNKSSSFLSKGLDSLSRKQEENGIGAKSVLKKDVEKDVNKTGAVPLALEPTDDIKKGEERGLSRTQIVVISTCSAVIGLFFLIAGTLRIRNYYKRYRSRRDGNQNDISRGSSLRLPGSTNSSCNLRRDSSCSKASRQSHTTNKSGGDTQITRHDKHSLFPHSSPALSIADQKPLLPGHSKLSQHSNDSSHASIAYIDEDSSSRIKVGDVNDDGSDENEDFPLLRKSPDSGSYVSLAMDSDKETKQVPEASNAPFKGETRHNASNNTQDGAGVISDKVNTEQSSTLNDISKDDKTLDDDEMPSEHGSIPDIIDHLNNGALSTEYNDPEYDKLCESCVVNAGLNQSVSSISENPSYSYGNQMEYSPYSGYEYGYSRNSFGNDVIKDNTLDINCADDSGLVSNFLENEGNYRENGSCDEITNGLSDNLSNHIDLPEKVSSIHTRYKGGQANDGETTDTSLDKGLSESTVDPNECLSVVPHQPVWATDQSVV